MVFWGFSLILAVSFLGLKAAAVPRPQGESGQIEQAREHHKHTDGRARATPIMTAADASPGVTAPNGGDVFNGNPGVSSTSQGADTLPISVPTTSSATQTSIPVASTTPTFSFFESNWLAPQSFNEGEKATVYYQINGIPVLDGVSFNPVLFVCQTNSSTPNLINSLNTWSVAQIPNEIELEDPQHVVQLQNGQVLGNTVRFFSSFGSGGGSNYFFCLANRPQYINNFVCDSYGPLFTINTIKGHTANRRDLVPRQTVPVVTPVPGMPSTPLSIINYSGTISVPGASITATLPAATTLSVMTTTSGGPTGTITTMASSIPTSNSTPTSSSSGLSTAAKVGIALGALVLLAALLLGALFFLRRKHRSRSPPPEQVMLTRDMQTDSFSRQAILLEKETATRNSVANASPVDENLPIQRHSTHSPTAYNSVPAAYNSSPSSPPRRKPTSASAVSRISGPVSPRSVNASLTVSTPPDEYEEYRDQPMPVYGDARHSPRFHSTEERQGVKAPFLTEEGMSAEEFARLEEEERRIDAAIAEAERSGRR